MFCKDNLARAILVEDKTTYGDLLELARSTAYPEFEVRTVGSAGTVQIKFPHKEWVKPSEWAENHVTTITRNLYSDIERLEDIATSDKPLGRAGFLSRSLTSELLNYVVNQTFQKAEPEGRAQLIQLLERETDDFFNSLQSR